MLGSCKHHYEDIKLANELNSCSFKTVHVFISVMIHFNWVTPIIFDCWALVGMLHLFNGTLRLQLFTRTKFNDFCYMLI